MDALNQPPLRSRVSLLIADPDPALRETSARTAIALGYQAHTAPDTKEALALLETHSIDIVLLDAADSSVLDVLDTLRHEWAGVVAIVTSGQVSAAKVVAAMKHGAFDYLAKPFDLEEFKAALERAAEEVATRTEAVELQQAVTSEPSFGGLIGRSGDMQKLYRMVARLAVSDSSVLIYGESGTGKELVARQIHFLGPNRERPFIPVDCGSLVPTLIESELFGYTKGAFTGAQRSKEGLLQVAEGGTVFLDEIGELPLELQSKLLRALQQREIRPVGSTRTVPINVRIIAATNRDLQPKTREGKFRDDLYYRLAVVTLKIPPLRDRREDIPLLAAHFLDRRNRATGQHRVMSSEAVDALKAYAWPGNVRELENVIDHAYTLGLGDRIGLKDLPEVVRSSLMHAPERRTINPMDVVEKTAILQALEQTGGNKIEAAKLLNIGKTTLYRKLKEYRLKSESKRA